MSLMLLTKAHVSMLMSVDLVLQRCVDLLPEIKTIVAKMNKGHKELSDDVWLLPRVSDRPSGKTKHTQHQTPVKNHMISAVNASKAKLSV